MTDRDINIEELKTELNRLRLLPFGARRKDERLSSRPLLTEMGRRVAGTASQQLPDVVVQKRLIEAAAGHMEAVGPAVLAFFGADPETEGGSVNRRAQVASERMHTAEYSLKVAGESLERSAYFGPFIERVAIAIVEVLDATAAPARTPGAPEAETGRTVGALLTGEVDTLVRGLAHSVQDLLVWLVAFGCADAAIRLLDGQPDVSIPVREQLWHRTAPASAALFEYANCLRALATLQNEPSGSELLDAIGLSERHGFWNLLGIDNGQRAQIRTFVQSAEDVPYETVHTDDPRARQWLGSLQSSWAAALMTDPEDGIGPGNFLASDETRGTAAGARPIYGLPASIALANDALGALLDIVPDEDFGLLHFRESLDITVYDIAGHDRFENRKEVEEAWRRIPGIDHPKYKYAFDEWPPDAERLLPLVDQQGEATVMDLGLRGERYWSRLKRGDAIREFPPVASSDERAAAWTRYYEMNQMSAWRRWWRRRRKN